MAKVVDMATGKVIRSDKAISGEKVAGVGGKLGDAVVKKAVVRLTAAERLMRMVGNPKRTRTCACEQIRKLCSELAFDGEIRLTYSVVSSGGEGIVFKHDREHRLGLYDRSGRCWDAEVKGEAYWEAVLDIVEWYFKIKKRYKLGK